MKTRFEDTNLIRLVVKLKDLKSDLSHVVKSDDVRRSAAVRSGLIIVSGLLNEALDELSKMVPRQGDLAPSRVGSANIRSHRSPSEH